MSLKYMKYCHWWVFYSKGRYLWIIMISKIYKLYLSKQTFFHWLIAHLWPFWTRFNYCIWIPNMPVFRQDRLWFSLSNVSDVKFPIFYDSQFSHFISLRLHFALTNSIVMNNRFVRKESSSIKCVLAICSCTWLY